MRNCIIKCLKYNILRYTVNKQAHILTRTIFIPSESSLEQHFYPKLINFKDYHETFRYKSKNSKDKKGQYETDSLTDETEEASDEIKDRNTKILKINVPSLRVDAIIKSALGMARNKVETSFYESKIRINGKKVLKKSEAVCEGDEIDVIRGQDLKNPNFINVARVEIMTIKPNEDSISVKIKRNKALTIEAY